MTALVDQLKLGLDAPICLTWELTYACNLECVHCLRCESWWRRGELPWIELEPVRTGELKRMSLEERFTLNEFDTEDGSCSGPSWRMWRSPALSMALSECKSGGTPS